MKLWLMMLCSFTILFSEGMSQKLIVSTDKNRENAQESLLKLKVHFTENPNIRALSEANDLKLELETLGAYTMVVVKPVKSLSVKNSLLMELSPVFPDIFALEVKNVHSQIDHSETLNSVNSHDVQTNRVSTYIETIGLQWVALLILSTVGLLLSIIRRKKLHHLDEKQKELDLDQHEIENGIKNLGKYNA